jgi:nitroreductase
MKTNQVIDAILSRRSVRSFTDESLSHEDLEAIVECGRWAPSANNRQGWCFVAVEDRESIRQLAEAVGAAIGRDGYDMYDPAAIVIVGHAQGAPFGREDDGCAMQNMFLAAYSLGIGSVWINQLQGICGDSAVETELCRLGLDAGYEVHGVCALGYRDRSGSAPARMSDIVWA